MVKFLPSLKPNAFNSAKKAWYCAAVARASRLGPRIPMRQTLSGCCAPAASGHAVAELTIPLMKSRRRITAPKAQDCADLRSNYSRVLRQAKWGSGVSLHSSNSERFMSALGQKRTSEHVQSMSALPPKADIETQQRHVRFVPKADIRGKRSVAKR